MRAVKAVVNSLVSVLTTAVLAVAVFFLVAVTSGYRPYVVLSGSMEPEIRTGSICLIDTNAPYEALAVGDVIAFTNGRISVTHRVVEIRDKLIQTKGDANESPDHYFISEENYLGKEVLSVPFVGYAVSWLQTKRGIILTVTTGISLMLLDGLIGETEKKKAGEKQETETKQMNKGEMCNGR